MKISKEGVENVLRDVRGKGLTSFKINKLKKVLGDEGE